MNLVKPFYQNYSDGSLVLNTHRKKITIVQRNGTSIISKSDVDFLKADNNYTELHLKGGQVILCSKTLKFISQKLCEANFIKVHKSYVINIDKVCHIDSSYSEISMECGAKIPVSRSCKSSLKDTLKVRFD